MVNSVTEQWLRWHREKNPLALSDKGDGLTAAHLGGLVYVYDISEVGDAETSDAIPVLTNRLTAFSLGRSQDDAWEGAMSEGWHSWPAGSPLAGWVHHNGIRSLDLSGPGTSNKEAERV
jgi:hypothetical protein